MLPEISVIITTRNRGSYLDLTLSRLEAQIMPPELFEVVVCDDASGDATPDVLQACRLRARIDLVALRSDRPRGYGSGRNACLDRAQGGFIVFLSDDQLVLTDFLLRHLAAHRAGTSRLVLGRVAGSVTTHLFDASGAVAVAGNCSPSVNRNDLNQPGGFPWRIAQDGPSYDPLFGRDGGAAPDRWAWFSAVNASTARERALTVGGFDERYHGTGIADQDFARRLLRSGCAYHWEPGACSLRQAGPVAPVDRRLLRADIDRFLAAHPDLTPVEIELVRASLSVSTT